MEKTIIVFRPEGKMVEVEVGTTLLEAAKKAWIKIESLCGGKSEGAPPAPIPMKTLPFESVYSVFIILAIIAGWRVYGLHIVIPTPIFL